MVKKINCLLLIVVFVTASAQSQWQLQTWVEKYGEVPYAHLGQNIVSIPQNPNLPYRVGVEEVGKTNFYTFSSQSDTSVKLVLPVENLITGDLNNDGYLDMVGRRNFQWDTADTSFSWDTIYVYWGTATGYDSLNVFKIPGERNHLRVYPMCIGDVNNDGFNDLVLSSPSGYNTPWGGEVYLFFGDTIKKTPDKTLIYDSTKFSDFGGTCNIVDLNNDGFTDLIMPGQVYNTLEKYVYIQIFWGANSNSNFLNKTEMRGSFTDFQYTTCFDVNGDTIPDILWKRTDSTRCVYIYYGGNDFDSTKPSLRLTDPETGIAGSIVNAGDMNGDGYDDIAVGAPRASMINGFIFIYSGGSKIDGNYDAAVGLGLASYFGTAIASVGDVNGDSLADIIVGAPEYPDHEDPFDQRAFGYWGIFLGSKNILVTSVKNGGDNAVPFVLELSQNYPNPFNPSTTISYQIPKDGMVSLKIYDMLGREVITLVDEHKTVGYYTAPFDASGLSSGMYIYRIVSQPAEGGAKDFFASAKKMMLLK